MALSLKLVFLAVFAALLCASSYALVAPSAFAGKAVISSSRAATARSGLSMEYIPDGLTKEAWEAIKAKERQQRKDLGKVGTTRFKSRSFQAWHEAGGQHLFPVDPNDVKSGKIKLSEVPYMQRGGAWDDSDLVKKEKGIKVQQWSKTDKMYSTGGERRAQSINIFGTGANLPWQGRAKFVNPDAVDPKKEQAKYKRAATNLPPNKMALARIEREKAELAKQTAKKQAELATTIKKEGKKFFLF